MTSSCHWIQMVKHKWTFFGFYYFVRNNFQKYHRKGYVHMRGYKITFPKRLVHWTFPVVYNYDVWGYDMGSLDGTSVVHVQKQISEFLFRHYYILHYRWHDTKIKSSRIFRGYSWKLQLRECSLTYYGYPNRNPNHDKILTWQYPFMATSVNDTPVPPHFIPSIHYSSCGN